MHVKVGEFNFVLVLVLYNPNTETEQVATLHDLDEMLMRLLRLLLWDYHYDKHIDLVGDFNFFFDTSLDSYGGKPTLKKKSIPNLLNLKKSLICVTFGE